MRRVGKLLALAFALAIATILMPAGGIPPALIRAELLGEEIAERQW